MKINGRMKAGSDQKARPLKVIERQMPADLETPVSAFLKLQEYGARVLLESVESGTIVGRYSFIGLKPKSKLIVLPDEVSIVEGDETTRIKHPESGNPLDSIKQIMACFRLDAPGDHPRLLGGAVGYVSYDMVRFFEKVEKNKPDNLNLPVALFYLIDTLLVFDHVQRRLTLMGLAEPDEEAEVTNRLLEIENLLKEPLKLKQPAKSKPTQPAKSNYTEKDFCDAVKQVQEFIRAGDCYQTVISQRFSGDTTAEPFMIYRALRMLNPSPYMFYLDFDDHKLIGSSPEALVRLEDGLATVRPIAGTRPRGKNEAEDQALAAELLADEKERAEHVMLVDLGRNDLGRCCEIGSVKVTEFMSDERYSHVMHLTSNVTGQLKAGMDQFDLFQATFPAGTVTGAPKIRSMQLIEQIEPEQRGPYAGAAGFFSLSGDMDWCITIRTIIMQGSRYHLQAGAGIVADSVPKTEFEETRSKLAALTKAIELAEEGF